MESLKQKEAVQEWQRLTDLQIQKEIKNEQNRK